MATATNEKPAPNGQPTSSKTPDPTTQPTVSDDFRDDLRRQRKHVAEKHRAWEVRKSQAKEAKAAYELAVEKLIYLIDEDEKGPRLPFGKTSEDWSAVPLTEALVDVSASVVEKLAEASIRTVGELQAHSEANKEHARPLTLVPGIGEQKAEKIEAALEAFWTRRKDAGLDQETEQGEDDGEQE